MQPKELVTKWIELFKPKDVNWKHQMIMAKTLTDKYTVEELFYALEYYRSKGVQMYSLGFLSNNMDDPCSMLKAEKTIQVIGGTNGSSKERNWKRVIQADKSKHRKNSVSYLFEES